MSLFTNPAIITKETETRQRDWRTGKINSTHLSEFLLLLWLAPCTSNFSFWILLTTPDTRMYHKMCLCTCCEVHDRCMLWTHSFVWLRSFQVTSPTWVCLTWVQHGCAVVSVALKHKWVPESPFHSVFAPWVEFKSQSRCMVRDLFYVCMHVSGTDCVTWKYRMTQQTGKSFSALHTVINLHQDTLGANTKQLCLFFSCRKEKGNSG